MGIGSTIAHILVVTGSTKNLATADIGNTTPIITQLVLGTIWIGQLMALGILTLKMQRSSTLNTKVGTIQVAQTPTMEPPIHMETIVKTMLQILLGVVRTMMILSSQVRCAVLVEEVHIMTTLKIMAFGIISMDRLEPGLYQVTDHQVIGQEMMVLIVVPGLMMMATQQLEPGKTLIILNQVNGSQQQKIHTPDILL